jgi:hypothetical protein
MDPQQPTNNNRSLPSSLLATARVMIGYYYYYRLLALAFEARILGVLQKLTSVHRSWLLLLEQE